MLACSGCQSDCVKSDFFILMNTLLSEAYLLSELACANLICACTERTKAERHKTVVESGTEQAYAARLVDQGAQRTRQEVLVCAHWQDVLVLQVSLR